MLALPVLDPNPPDAYEEQVVECASCLAEIREDDQHQVHEGGDVKCLTHAADEDAWPIVAAEITYPYSPSRTIAERRAAVEVIRVALSRAVERIDRDEARLRAASRGGRCRCGSQMIAPGQTSAVVVGRRHALHEACEQSTSHKE